MSAVREALALFGFMFVCYFVLDENSPVLLQRAMDLLLVFWLLVVGGHTQACLLGSVITIFRCQEGTLTLV